jgi:hypothetical protein
VRWMRNDHIMGGLLLNLLCLRIGTPSFLE